MDPSGKLIGKARSLTAAAALACATLAGCYSYGPGPLRAGDAAADLVARMGPPTERIARAGGGERLVYARGPWGQHTWMIDVGGDGRVQQWHMALEEAHRMAIEPGLSREQVLGRLGPPAEKRALAIENRSFWAWRFPTRDCLWFMVTFDANGRVLDSGHGPDPACEAGGNDRE